MNLLSVLKERIEKIPEGEYSQGLKSVLQHIEVASRHLARGQTSLDETAFTDAIYRTNQAFEGSLKEAYRVLAGKDPNRTRPFDIEDYFQQNSVLRPRVLAQFKNYRQEWRNPSAHDYRLDFDEDEALLAIVTVSAFAIVLTDQIAERVAFQQAQAVAGAAHLAVAPTSTPLLERSAKLIEQFTAHFKAGQNAIEVREVEVVGALGGFLATAANDISTQIESKLVSDRPERADFVLTSKTERVLVEIKRSRKPSRVLEQDAIRQVAHYMAISSIKQAIIYIFCSPNTGKVSHRTEKLPGIEGEVVVIVAEPSPA
jgi:hypothetical protein